MSSSEEYLDSLLDSILGGNQSDNGSKTENSQAASGEPRINTEAGKAMSTAEIEEMFVSMGTLGNGEDGAVSENMPEELSLDDVPSEDLSLDDISLDDLLPDELSVEESASEESVDLGAAELSLDDVLSEELSLGDISQDDLSSDEFSLQESASEESVDLGAAELSLDDMLSEELSLDSMPSEELSPDAMPSDAMSLDDISLDDLSADEFSAEESASDESVNLGAEELSLDGILSDDLSLDDISLDDLSTDNLSLEDQSLDELPAEEDALEESVDSGTDDLSPDELSLDDLSLDDLHLDDLSLEETGEESAGGDESEGGMEIGELDLSEDVDLGDLALEEHMMDEMEASDDDADGLMSAEDIDRLLNGEDDGEPAGDFALEESEEGAEGDDDLAALLAGMDHDEELSEINNLLEESDQGVSADDDMLAMLEGTDDENGNSFDFFENDEAAREAESIRELSPEEIAAREGSGKEKPKKEKKKRKKLFGRKKKDGDGEEESTEGAGTKLEDLLGTDGEEAETPAEEKKPGLVTKILNFLLESDEEEEDPLAAEILADNAGETGTVTDENKELLAELSEEDKKGKKKKKKDKKKGKKGKEGEGEEGAEDAEGEEDKKAKKKKKKEKKEKKASEVDLLAPPEKKLSKKKVMTVFVLCGTIAACIVLISTFLPTYMQKRQAHVAYDHRDYNEVFTLLYDKNRSEQDEILFQRSNIVLQMERKLDSYDNYVRLNMRLEALNALISGVDRYRKLLPDAEKYNVVGEVSDSYSQILERLSADFGVSEEQALVIIASEDDVTYSQLLEAIINGTLSNGEESGARQDILPEEEEIIERIEGLE